jgi:hypothetical protein
MGRGNVGQGGVTGGKEIEKSDKGIDVRQGKREWRQ